MKLDWNKLDGLIPAIIQDAHSGKVLMLGYMNQESLQRTQETKRVTFFSRSRQSIWIKGETSGNFLHVIKIEADCDEDALLIQVNPEGPTCHRGYVSCFDQTIDFISELENIIDDRIKNPTQKSYVAKLIQEGLDRVAQKVGEEAIETVISSKNNDLDHFENEAADLIFHLMVLLQVKGSSLPNIIQRLRLRHTAKK